jgi:alpha-beta hydrolase superfamily lysophospholipase
MRHSRLARAFYCSLSLVLCACAPNYAYRTNLILAGEVKCPLANVKNLKDAQAAKDCEHVTPEVDEGVYELHFVEFDDQGWLYPDKTVPGNEPAANPSGQIDHLMERLTQLLEQQHDLSIIVFVHGWKHGAQVDDPNVVEFRTLLQSLGVQENSRARPRKVVGVYVGWRGKSWELPDPALSLTFWARKEAARRISVGSARELFARLRAIRRHHNEPAQGKTTTGAASEQQEARPRIRTLMIGHSFGGLIIYAAMSGSLIEALTVQQDLENHEHGEDAVERPADMIVLINPAFEASRYEALYHVANSYKPQQFQPPLFVSVTSEKDWATGIAFPAGRSVNTFFEHPISSSEEEVAMKNTPGHIPHYLTHRLYARAPDASSSTNDLIPGSGVYCPATWKSADDLKKLQAEAAKDAIMQNKLLEDSHSADFFSQSLTSDHLLKPKWGRTFCGGGYLTPVDDKGVDNSNAVVWNVEADGEVIKNHDDVMNPIFQGFMRQLYADVSSHPVTKSNPQPGNPIGSSGFTDSNAHGLIVPSRNETSLSTSARTAHKFTKQDLKRRTETGTLPPARRSAQ